MVELQAQGNRHYDLALRYMLEAKRLFAICGGTVLQQMDYVRWVKVYFTAYELYRTANGLIALGNRYWVDAETELAHKRAFRERRRAWLPI